MQPLFVSHYVTTPKAELFPEPQRVLSLCPFQKKPLQTLSQPAPGYTAPCLGQDQALGVARAPMRACGCSLGDYEHVCAGRSHCPQCPVPRRGQRGHSGSQGLLCPRNQTRHSLLSSLTKGTGSMGKMFLRQQGSASQVRF